MSNSANPIVEVVSLFLHGDCGVLICPLMWRGGWNSWSGVGTMLSNRSQPFCAQLGMFYLLDK